MRPPWLHEDRVHGSPCGRLAASDALASEGACPSSIGPAFSKERPSDQALKYQTRCPSGPREFPEASRLYGRPRIYAASCSASERGLSSFVTLVHPPVVDAGKTRRRLSLLPAIAYFTICRGTAAMFVDSLPYPLLQRRCSPLVDSSSPSRPHLVALSSPPAQYASRLSVGS